MKLVLNGFAEDENFEEHEVSPEERVRRDRRSKSLKMSFKNPLELFLKESLSFSLS